MKTIRLKVNDPDNFLNKVDYNFVYSDKGHCSHHDIHGIPIIRIEEGELPPRPPTFSYEEIDDD